MREGTPPQDFLAVIFSHADLLHIDVLIEATAVVERLDKGVVPFSDCCALHIQFAPWLQQCRRWALWVALQLLPLLLLKPGLKQGPGHRCNRK